MVGAIGGVGIGVGIGGGIGIGGASGNVGAIGGLPDAPGVGDVAGSEGPASTAPAAPPAGIQVSISMAARQALASDMAAAGSSQRTAVQVNAGIDQLTVNVQIQDFPDLQNWDELIAALILVLLQNRKDNGS